MEPNTPSLKTVPTKEGGESIVRLSLKDRFTTVTSFSKYAAMVLFVALPFIGFYLGQQYQMTDLVQNNTSNQQSQLPVNKNTNLLVKEESGAASSSYKTYQSEYGFSFTYPSEFTLQDMLAHPNRKYFVPNGALLSIAFLTPYLCEDVACVRISVVPRSLRDETEWVVDASSCWQEGTQLIGKGGTIHAVVIGCGDAGVAADMYYITLNEQTTLEIVLDRSASAQERVVPPTQYADGRFEKQFLSSIELSR